MGSTLAGGALVPLAAITLAWQFASLPSLPPERGSRAARSALGVLRSTQARYGVAAVTLFFMGQFALFTYLRPFLETVTRVNVSTLSVILLIIGGAGLLGTYLIGPALKRLFYSLLIGMPLAMSVIAVALIALGSSCVGTALLLGGWGLIGTAAPVAWWTWLSRTMPDDAEAGGGLMVAAIQLAITLGAATGGWLFDSRGYESTFGVSAALLVGSALVAVAASRATRPAVSAVA